MDVANLPARLNARLARGRAVAEARMTSRVAVMRKTGLMDQDPVSGEEVPEWAAVYVDLPFRLVFGRSRTVSIGGVEFEEATARGDMPADTHDLADGDLLDIHAGEWAGSTYRLVEAIKGDQMTARRAPVVEVARPEEW